MELMTISQISKNMEISTRMLRYVISINFKEDQRIAKLNKAKEKLSNITDVQVMYLLLVTVASVHYVGDEPEYHVHKIMEKFICNNKLHKIKPDLRSFGCNHPNPIDETDYHGYEEWITIPDTMEVKDPIWKKKFPGGLYRAYMIYFGDFTKWDVLLEWADTNQTYEFAGNIQDQEHMCGLLEERLNYFSHIDGEDIELKDIQMDLLVPLKRRIK